MRPLHFLIEEPGEAVLIDRRRQRLGAGGFEGAIEEPAADAADESAQGPMRQQYFGLGGIIVERGADLAAVQLRMLVAAHAEGGAIRLQQAGALRGAGTDAERVPPRRQRDQAFFDDGNAVPGVVVAVTRSDIGVLAGP